MPRPARKERAYDIAKPGLSGVRFLEMTERTFGARPKAATARGVGLVLVSGHFGQPI
jgi:hypothetical protein